MRKWMITLTLALALMATAAITLSGAFVVRAEARPRAVAATSSTVLTDTATLTDTAATSDTAATTATTEITALTVTTDEAYVSVNLAAGFPLDPFIVSVNGGGPVDASTLGPDCVGQISQAPVVAIDWEGEADLARIFYFSDHNPSLVIERPDGTILCNDNANIALHDPSIDLENPEKGTYRIWVGNVDDKGLIPGVLVLTTKPQFAAATFQLQGLIKRPALTEREVSVMDALPQGDDLKALLVTLLEEETGLPVLEEGVELTASVEITGQIPGFVWPVADDSPDALCSGLSEGNSQLDFTVAEGTASLRILFDSDADGALVVFTPDGTALCQDDSEDGANRNPVIDIENPAPGNYAIMIGRIADVEVLTGTVTVTTDMERTPSLLEPAAPAESSN